MSALNVFIVPNGYFSIQFDTNNILAVLNI